MKNLIEYLPFLIPVIIIEYGLAAAAIVHAVKHRHYRFGNLALWVVLSLCVGFIGPILYFTLGKGDD